MLVRPGQPLASATTPSSVIPSHEVKSTESSLENWQATALIVSSAVARGKPSIQQEARLEVEKKLQEWSEVAFNISGQTPEVVIKEGVVSEEIIKFLDEDKKVRFLVLAASDEDNPGPLVSLLAGQRSGKLPIPTLVIPGGLSSEEIDDLASRAQ